MKRRGKWADSNIVPILIIVTISYLEFTGGFASIGQSISDNLYPPTITPPVIPPVEDEDPPSGGGVSITTYNITMLTPQGQGLTTPTSGNYTYLEGTRVDLTATPADGWVFLHWTIDGRDASTSPTSYVTSNRNKILKAIFTQKQPETIIVNDTIIITSSFDGGGNTYKRGPLLGDNQIMRLSGTGNTLRNCYFDDSNLGGSNGAVAITGIGNTIENCTIDNCQRYGFIVQNGVNWTIRRCTVLKAQHGISGSTGYDGQWSPSRGGLIENCTISGIIIHGIKLKNMDGVTVRNNIIDLYPTYPGYDGSRVPYGKVGLVFAGGDSAVKNAVVENNLFYESSPITWYTVGVEATPDGKNKDGSYKCPERMDNNIIRNNIFQDIDYGVYLSNNNFKALENSMIKVEIEYTNNGTNNNIS